MKRTFEQLYRYYIDLGCKAATLSRLKECLEHYHRNTSFYRETCEQLDMVREKLDKFNKTFFIKEEGE